ncbi:hypothetical protein AB9Q10_27500 [Streptomyces krungchingensis]|uniref:hypothetical protein n=1 Tax=Streptomyces krungchingensis TaxID=1565034 RepID=UPI003CEBBCFD
MGQAGPNTGGNCRQAQPEATFYTRPDVIALRVDDIGPNEVALAWVAARRSRLVHDFAQAAADTLARPHIEEQHPTAHD